MADVAGSVFEEAHGPFELANMQPTASESGPACAGIKSAVRKKQGRNAGSWYLIVDAQSVKNSDTAGQKGYDAGKKISGIKRHIAVDTQGLPHAAAVTTANVTDRTGALFALRQRKSGLK